MKRPSYARDLLTVALFLGSVFQGGAASGEIEVPVPVNPGLNVELVAAEPDLCTPTAVQVGRDGRIWVLENHTHSRPVSYQGPETDRVLVFGGFDATGRARDRQVYAEGFRDGMGLLLLGDGDVVVSTRSSVLRFRDRDGDGRGEDMRTLVSLSTSDAYPHNGISGLARQKSGRLFFGLGENHGVAWEMRGADGRTLQGSDEGGVFAVDPEGNSLEWWALGLWNPFGLTFGPEGALFAVDNDPAGGSLSRLLHIVPGGDYGYRYRYGRTTRHPFVSWFGARPGTLPPVCLVGEAPTGVLQFASAKLGDENTGKLLVATWTEHGVQRLPLERGGLSYRSEPEWILRGGHYFRPSGLAEAPDGSLVIADWADPAYEVHGKGRLWRLRGEGRLDPGGVGSGRAGGEVAQGQGLESRDRERYARLEAGLSDFLEGTAALRSMDPYMFRAGILALAREPASRLESAARDEKEGRVRLGLLLALRKGGGGRGLLENALKDPDEEVRRAALQWIADDQIPGWEGRLETALTGGVSRETFQSYLAALELFRPGKPDPRATAELLAKMAVDTGRVPAVRALALRSMVPWLPVLDPGELSKLSADANGAVALEATRILAGRKDPESLLALRGIVESAGSRGELKLEAVAGLTLASSEAAVRGLLEGLAASGDAALAIEAKRSLGRREDSWESAGQVPIQRVLEVRGDPMAGRRLFYHPNGPGCSVCHAVEGRGGGVGPDLTDGARMPVERLLESIREPSREIAPAFGTWRVEMKDGAAYLGIDLFEDNKKLMTLVDAAGTKHKLAFTEMTAREPVPVSLMPPGLDARLSLQELRDLLAFLTEPR
jgi:putative membrane-bound dehydrogenase-like protein